MDEQGKLLEAMRRNLRRIHPQLVREGWTQAQIAEVSTAVREHLATGNRPGLDAVAQWLSDRAWALLEQERKTWAEIQARECRVSYGPKQEAVIRALNGAWARHRTN